MNTGLTITLELPGGREYKWPGIISAEQVAGVRTELDGLFRIEIPLLLALEKGAARRAKEESEGKESNGPISKTSAQPHLLSILRG